MRPPLVVKLGGSLEAGGHLTRTLACLVEMPERPVIVPGGGVFADAVRTAQARAGFSDGAAHRMALLAMEQMAHLIVDRHPAFRLADSVETMGQVSSEGYIPVWMPVRMAGHDPTLPQDWTLTSDGLAAYLAVRLKARGVVLLKSCPIPSDAGVETLSMAGLVDPVFAEIVIQSGIPWRVLGLDDRECLATLTFTDLRAEADTYKSG